MFSSNFEVVVVFFQSISVVTVEEMRQFRIGIAKIRCSLFDRRFSRFDLPNGVFHVGRQSKIIVQTFVNIFERRSTFLQLFLKKKKSFERRKIFSTNF